MVCQPTWFVLIVSWYQPVHNNQNQLKKKKEKKINTLQMETNGYKRLTQLDLSIHAN
jgi:hypothetical protein